MSRGVRRAAVVIVGGGNSAAQILAEVSRVDRGVLKDHPMFARLTPVGVDWPDGTHQHADAIIWCTGFRPALRHLRPLGLHDPRGHVALDGPSANQDAVMERLR